MPYFLANCFNCGLDTKLFKIHFFLIIKLYNKEPIIGEFSIKNLYGRSIG